MFYPWQSVQEPGLRGDEFLPRGRDVDPLGPVDLGERLAPARARRPFQLEGVADDGRDVEVRLERPGRDDLAVALDDLTEGDERAVRGGRPQFLGELPAGRGQRVLV